MVVVEVGDFVVVGEFGVVIGVGVDEIVDDVFVVFEDSG